MIRISPGNPSSSEVLRGVVSWFCGVVLRLCRHHLRLSAWPSPVMKRSSAHETLAASLASIVLSTYAQDGFLNDGGSSTAVFGRRAQNLHPRNEIHRISIIFYYFTLLSNTELTWREFHAGLNAWSLELCVLPKDLRKEWDHVGRLSPCMTVI